MKKILLILLVTVGVVRADWISFTQKGTGGKVREKLVEVVPGSLFGVATGTGGITYFTPSSEFSFSGTTLSLSGTQSGNHVWSGTNDFIGTLRINGIALGSLAFQSGTFSGTTSGVNTGDQTISLTGDVAGSGSGSFATTVVASSTTVAGKIAIATSAQVTTGTATTVAVVPSTLAAWWSAIKSTAQTITANWTFSGTTTANVVSATTATVTTGTMGTLNVTGNAAVGGQLTLPGQTASTSDSAMTRGLSDLRYLERVWNPRELAAYGTATDFTYIVANTMVTISCADGANTRFTLPIGSRTWSGKTAVVEMVYSVSGTSGGNVAWRGNVAYRNTALSGTAAIGYSGGSSNGTAGDTSVTGRAVPSTSNGIALMSSSTFSIPAGCTAAAVNINIDRTSGSDTNTDTLNVYEVRITGF